MGGLAENVSPFVFGDHCHFITSFGASCFIFTDADFQRIVFLIWIFKLFLNFSVYWGVMLQHFFINLMLSADSFQHKDLFFSVSHFCDFNIRIAPICFLCFKAAFFLNYIYESRLTTDWTLWINRVWNISSSVSSAGSYVGCFAQIWPPQPV